MNARDENIFDIFQISIDVKNIVLEIIKFDKEINDKEDDERIVTVIQSLVSYDKLLLHRLEESARRMSDMLEFLQFLAESQLFIITDKILILMLLCESLWLDFHVIIELSIDISKTYWIEWEKLMSYCVWYIHSCNNIFFHFDIINKVLILMLFDESLWLDFHVVIKLSIDIS